MNDKIFLTVIVPAYNEEKNIRGTLEEIAGYLNERAFTYEMLVIDDGSSDKTSEIAGSCSNLFKNYKVLKNISNEGKGYSVRRAMLEAKGEYALFMDADNSTSIDEFDKFLPYLQTNYDVVIASRRMEGSMVEEPQPFLRAKMGEFYIFLSKVMLNMNISDFNCGFKAYNVKSARRIFEAQRMHDWSFDTELLFLSAKYGLKIKEVPVRWVHKATSKVRPVRDGIRSFLSLFKIKINDFSGKYKA